jgi:bifunctional UDP-N-acetylglucosamine pyrophosphorylase/glucosamine-1-phosphate N-acetyltransferase
MNIQNNKDSKEIAFLILAAGKGTRMNSGLPKVLHKISGKPLIDYVIETTQKFRVTKLLPILSPSLKEVENSILSKYNNAKIIYQNEQLGTGHAVKICLEELSNFEGVVVALYGDTPFIKADTIQKMINSIENNVAICVLGFNVNYNNAYGRLVTNSDNTVLEIVEFKEASEVQKQINLCNSGVMAFNGKFLKNIINTIDNKNSKGEYYLTDAVKIANQQGYIVKSITTYENEVIGINSQEELAIAEKILQNDLRKQHLENGVIITDPESVFFSAETKIESGTVIEPFVVFKGKVKIGKNCEIRSFSHLEDCFIEDKVVIGPYARIRPDSQISENAHIGNFVEIKKSKIGKGSKINHLSYIGDCEMGERVNIGAGTITCNYDGVNKHKTIIEDGVFVGSNTEIIAPKTIKKNSVIGAGTTILQNVEENSLVITQKKQISLEKKKN